MLRRALLQYAPKAAASARCVGLQQSRTLSSALPDGWETIKRRNGDVVYYNADLRKTVRHLPGVKPQDVAPSQSEEKGEPERSTAATVPHHESSGDEVFVPIDFNTAMSIEGHDSQVVHIELEPEQCLRAETGAMIYMTDGVEMETTTAGGIGEGMKRMMTGENFFVSRFTYHGDKKGKIALGTSFPSKIVHLRLNEFLGESIICQKGAFLCGSDTVNIEMEFAKKFGVGFFGGEGFILQRLTGSGDVLVRASGTLIERELQPGEVLRISSGCLVAFEPSVHYDITMMKGAKNVLFGGEGLFVTTLTGPGKIYLQSLPFDRVVGEMASRIPRGGPGGMMLPFMMGGGGDQGASAGAGDETAAATETPVLIHLLLCSGCSSSIKTEAMADDDGASVRVAVRIRPLIGREKVERCDECVSVLEEENQIVMGKNRAFTYDYVFGKYVQQSDIWRCVDPLIKATFDGYNSTIFAYGQTGSGKTYTMGSGSSVHIPPEDYGIIPRVISYMFEQIDSKTLENPHYKADLQIRFLEIYGEEIHDLLVTLDDSTGENKVSLREAENGEVQVTGASEVCVDNADECMRLLERGTLCRTTGSTLMNAHSSRSHAIFTVTMVQHVPIRDPPADGSELGDGDYETRSSYFNFVDLAGSERQKRTQAEGKRLKEGIDINKGLLALGNVISALGDDKKRGRVHVPYRDSKLTRMLQDSLGGNSRTLMLTCVSPADVNFEETLNALKYANRARNIQNKPVVNRDESSELRRQLEMLQMEVHRLRNPGLSESELKMATVGTNFIGMDNDFDSFGNLRTRAENAENEVARLIAELKRGKTQLDHLKEEMIAAQAERDYLRLCVEENAGGSTTTPEEKESKSNVLKDQLRTICELQEKLRSVERERDNAMMNFPGSVIDNGGSRPTTAAAIPLPSFVEVDTKVGSELLEQVEKEIEKETALLNKLKEADSGDDVGGESDGGGADGNSSADNMEVEEETQEEADRMRVFEKRQRHLGESVQDLAHDISLKEQLVQNIRQAQANYDRMKTFYEQKMAQMVEEVRTAQVDRDRLADEIQQIERKIQAEGGPSGGDGRLSKLSRDLKTKEEELQALRRKQNDMNRFMNQKKKNEMQLRVLNSEITNMKRQKVDLVKKMQEERKRYEEEAKQRRREIMNLKRSQQRDKQQILRLGTQKDAQERVLKRKMEEVTAAKQRLKQQQQLTAQARKMNASNGRKKSAGSNRADRDAKLLSEEVKKRAEEQQKLEQLQKEREVVAKEMEALYAQRDKLEKEVQNSISSQTNIRDVLTSPMPNTSLSRRNSGRQEQQLTPAEEQLLYDLEERIEACQAQLEYKEEKISEISDDVRAMDGVNTLAKIETTQSLPEARTLLKMLFGMAVDVKKQDQRKEQELAKQQVEMADLARHLEQEREKTAQIKQSYEESLQRVVNGGMASDESSSAQEPLDERSRVLLSVSEERNAVLRKKCEELEAVSHTMDQEKQEIATRLEQEEQDLVASRDRVRYLESQLAKLTTVVQEGNQTGGRARIRIPTSTGNKFAAASGHTPTGPSSWANDFVDDDEDMGTDEQEDDHDEDATMRSDDDDNDLLSRSPKHDRRRFRMELENVSGNPESGSISSQKSRLSHNTLRRYGNGEENEHDDGGDEGNANLKEDHIGSDDSTSTGASSKSIFSRLSNPTNFTGIHKNRVRESVSKREILQNRSERNRSRRLKDKGQLKLSRSSNPPTEQFVATPSGFKNPPSFKSNSVLEVLANMKRENESEQYVSSSGLRQPMSYVTTDRPRDYSSDDNEQFAPGSDTFGSAPPPAPVGDVYTRLAGQYTASAKSKRQHTSASSHREKGDEAEYSGKAGVQGIELEEDAHPIDQHEAENVNYSGNEDELTGDYDPLLGGESLIKQVHDDYRERLNQRNTGNKTSE
ncbi:hypothetical protein BBO99_00008463 [Phytophthora kernoviae]|uniref:Uncharacterized protein n=2 Tax=Phytophthora kernoviae TaxID=325452 RepID=A0A421EUX3_9STRA|nr:hypothetical protein G195_009802 [Phytophthora kernoviae 00238/432]KAG2515373.1 hypothetical protein JM18_008103 [Phytophthora kernoviae]RLN02851.1 hypothetical protein BBI17_008374 [Phytophthora kernoviae]RLN75264.1 hypothetical protein BBO99_00008463 [Phytophthora kernoviae]